MQLAPGSPGTAIEPPGDIPAATHGPTRAEIVSRRRNRTAGLGIAVGLFTIFLVVAATSSNHEDSLDSHGGRTPGTVTAIGGFSSFIDDPDIHVAYVVGGRRYVENVQLDDDSPRFTVGEPVTVEYERTHPADMTLPGQDNEPAWQVQVWISALALSVLAFIQFGLSLRRAHLRAGLLNSEPWELATLHGRERSRFHINGNWYRASSRSKAAKSLVPGPVWIVLSPDGRAIVAHTDGTHAVLMKPVVD
jgi:hypothetical protein